MPKEPNPELAAPDESGVDHVGGINDGLGGVDPEIDGTLMRLAGGP